jgi:hydroxysqualene synthase
MSETAPTIETDLTARSWSVEESFAYCEKLATRHDENFPVGSYLIPKKLRPHVHNLYAFARVADDFADEPRYTDSVRMALLENWEAQLYQCFWRQPQHPVFIALKETIKRFDLPINLFQDLLMAFKMDVVKKRYPAFSDVLDYCRHSANPIGRLVLLLFGYRQDGLHSLSDSICTALQITNFWQDLMIDLDKGRIYIPKEDLQRFGYSVEELLARVYNDAFKNLMRFEIGRTRDLFAQGQPLCSRVGRDLRFELHLICQGGQQILHLLEMQDYNIFSHRPVLTPRSWIWLTVKAFIKSRLPSGKPSNGSKPGSASGLKPE